MRVLAITPWDGQGTPSGQACGIANYAALLKEHLPGDVELIPCPEGLDAQWVYTPDSSGLYSHIPDVIWLNYHRGLHSRWTPEKVAEVQTMGRGRKVAITFHDTYGEAEPDALTRELYDLADAFVVHEPCVGLDKAVVIRQGVPAAQEQANLRGHGIGDYGVYSRTWLAYPEQPVLGTCGFNFPWKNFDRLAEVTAEAGWAYVVVSNNATDADVARWGASNPHTLVIPGYRSTPEIVAYLAGCDATAFPYQCANSGTSGAIRLGLAARKPVLAFSGCRQFRDLADTPDGLNIRIHWCSGWVQLQEVLSYLSIQRVDPGIVAIAERDSWAKQGQRYGNLFRGLLS